MSKFQFEDVYDCSFGDQQKSWANPAPDSNTYDVDFVTPSNSEDDVRFNISTMLFVHDKNIRLSILHDGVELYHDNRSLSMFVNRTGIDPKPLKVRDGTHGGAEYEVARTTHLLPNKKYTFRIWASRRTNLTTYYTGLATEDEIQYGTPMQYDGIDGYWFPKD